MVPVTKEQHDTRPDQGWVQDVCKMGQGAACCRYLAVDAKGFCCLRLTDAKAMLDERVAMGTMHARSDNCTGRAS